MHWRGESGEALQETGRFFSKRRSEYAQRNASRVKGEEEELLSSLASQDASRMDFGRHLDPLGLDFEQFLETLLA